MLNDTVSFNITSFFSQGYIVSSLYRGSYASPFHKAPCWCSIKTYEHNSSCSSNLKEDIPTCPSSEPPRPIKIHLCFKAQISHLLGSHLFLIPPIRMCCIFPIPYFHNAILQLFFPFNYCVLSL